MYGTQFTNNNMKYSLLVNSMLFLGGPVGTESACKLRTPEFDPWVRKIPWRREWQPTPVFLPGEVHDRRAWQATVYGVAKSQTRLDNSHFHFRSLWNPLVCTTLSTIIGSQNHTVNKYLITTGFSQEGTHVTESSSFINVGWYFHLH